MRVPRCGALRSVWLPAAFTALAGVAFPRSDRPNIVVLQTDDQDCGSLEARRPDNGDYALAHVRALLCDRGVTFSRSFVSLPLCCPSRAALLTGQYTHNHHVYGNSAPWGGHNRLDHANTLPVWLAAAGYETVHVGKYLNGYNGQSIPPGWAQWFTIVGGSYYGYSMNENGTLVQYGYAEADYSTDVLTEKAVRFIRERGPDAPPFFLMVDYIAPHVGPVGEGVAIPAPRHAGIFDAYAPAWPPSFDEPDVSDKSIWIQALPRFDAATIASVTESVRSRLGSLLAVDEGVARIVRALNLAGELERTCIVFTSDNGFLLGEHRVPGGKDLPYDESIRVPLIVRGPGVRAGVVEHEIVGNIDLAPTIVSWAGATAGRVMDGAPLQPLLAGRRTSGGREFLIANYAYSILHPELVRSWVGVRNDDFAFIRYEGSSGGSVQDVEIYSLGPEGCPPTVDPFQLENRRTGCPPARIRDLACRLTALSACAGESCR